MSGSVSSDEHLEYDSNTPAVQKTKTFKTGPHPPGTFIENAQNRSTMILQFCVEVNDSNVNTTFLFVFSIQFLNMPGGGCLKHLVCVTLTL